MSGLELGFDLVITFLLSAGLLFHYGNWYRHHVIVTFAVLIAWYFSLIIVTVIPLDVSNTIYRQCQSSYRNISTVTATANSSLSANLDSENATVTECPRPASYLEPAVLPNLWRVVYWSSQFLTWILLPVMQSYTKAGEFTVQGKLKAALLDNVIYYGSYLFICGILLAYIAVKPELDLDWSRLKAIASSASNTWGLFLLVFMLGYGLVAVPRNIWNSSCKGHSLNRAYFKMAKLAAERNSAEEKLDDALESLSSSLKSLGPASTLAVHLDTIVTQIPLEFRERMTRRRVESPTAPVDQKYLIRLHRQIKSSLQNYHRTETQWTDHITRTLELEDIEKNSKSSIHLFKRTVGDKPKFIFGEKMEWYWHCIISNWLLKLLAAMTAIMSLFVIWSEATFFIKAPAVSLFAVFINRASENYDYFTIEVISTLTTAYLCVCAYYTVFKIRVLNYYYLASRHQTDEYSLIFAGMFLCRLTPPICLNFLGMIHMDSHVIKDVTSETAYTQIMGHLDVLSLISDGFNIYFPMGILLIGSLTYFKVGSRALNIIGFHQFLVEDEVTGELVTEGQQLIIREKRRRQRLEDSLDRRQKYRLQQPVANARTEVTEEPSTWTSSSPSVPINREREQTSYGTPERRPPPPRDLFDDV